MLAKQSTAMLCFLLFVTLASLCQAHSSLSYPCIRKSPLAECRSGKEEPDYNLRTPVGTFDSKNFPLCKNLTPPSKLTVVKAGQALQTAYDIGAIHGGGHCQWALSYDGGKQWVVVHTLIRECLKTAQPGAKHVIPVNIPKEAPNGKATLMWLWNNAVGNRELYSNCADIEIQDGTAGGKLSGVAPLIANYGPESLKIGEFPNPGDDDQNAAFNTRANITVTGPAGDAAPPAPAAPSETPKY
jgi:hypothetical protein